MYIAEIESKNVSGVELGIWSIFCCVLCVLFSYYAVILVFTVFWVFISLRSSRSDVFSLLLMLWCVFCVLLCLLCISQWSFCFQCSLCSDVSFCFLLCFLFFHVFQCCFLWSTCFLCSPCSDVCLVHCDPCIFIVHHVLPMYACYLYSHVFSVVCCDPCVLSAHCVLMCCFLLFFLWFICFIVCKCKNTTAHGKNTVNTNTRITAKHRKWKKHRLGLRLSPLCMRNFYVWLLDPQTMFLCARGGEAGNKATENRKQWTLEVQKTH